MLDPTPPGVKLVAAGREDRALAEEQPERSDRCRDRRGSLPLRWVLAPLACSGLKAINLGVWGRAPRGRERLGGHMSLSTGFTYGMVKPLRGAVTPVPSMGQRDSRVSREQFTLWVRLNRLGSGDCGLRIADCRFGMVRWGAGTGFLLAFTARIVAGDVVRSVSQPDGRPCGPANRDGAPTRLRSGLGSIDWG